MILLSGRDLVSMLMDTLFLIGCRVAPGVLYKKSAVNEVTLPASLDEKCNNDRSNPITIQKKNVMYT